MVVVVVLLVAPAACGGEDDDAVAPVTPEATDASDPVATDTEPDDAAPDDTGEVTGDTTTEERTIRAPDDRDRTYALVVPAGLPVDEPAPLVVGLHGGGGWGRQFADGADLVALAEEEGFVIALPDGDEIVPGSGQRTWNAGTCCGPSVRREVDDVAFVRQVVEEVVDDPDGAPPIDPDRVYAIGHSNGAMLAYRLACEAGDVFAAVAGEAGGLLVDACAPAQPVSLVHLHGTADTHVPVEGGVGEDSRAGVAFPAPADSVATFAEAIDCDGGPVEADDPANPAVTTRTWTCPDDAEVQLVLVEGATHTWMGSTRADEPGEEDSGVDASRVLWDFLAAHPRR